MEDLAPKWWLCWLTFMLRRYCKCFTSIEILDREWMNPIWLWKKGIPKSSDLPSCSLFCGIPHFQRNREWWLVNILNILDIYIYIIVNHHKWKIKILQTLHPFSLNKGLPSDRWAGALQSVLFCDRSLSLGFPWSPFPHWRCLIYLGEGVVFWLDALQVSGGIYYPATTTTKLLHTGYFRPLPSETCLFC